LWGKVAKAVNKAEWAGYALVYITEVNGIRTGRADQPDAQHRLHIHIGVSGTSKRERDLKHAYVCGIGPSQAVRVGAKALCAAFRVEEQPTELGGWGVGLRKLLREALARATATLPPPAIVVSPVFNAPNIALATAASPTTTLAPANSPASIAPAVSPASTLAPAASTLAPAASALAPAASALAPAASTLAPAASALLLVQDVVDGSVAGVGLCLGLQLPHGGHRLGEGLQPGRGLR